MTREASAPQSMPSLAGEEAVPSSLAKEGRDAERRIPGEGGIWIFILGDMTLYAGLFASFAVERSRALEVFNASAATLHTHLGAVNTLLLLCSSLLVALGVRACRERIRPELAPHLFAGAFACGLGFVGIKYVEYSGLIHEAYYPVTNMFYMYYYVLTGIHLTHLLAGMCVLLYLWRASMKPEATPEVVRGVENGASFWHAVDLLWIILFPLLYLMR